MHHFEQEEAFGHYLLKGGLGGGGFSEVYLAEDSRSGELVVLKNYRLSRLDSQKGANRFQRIARLLAELDCAGIPRFRGARLVSHGASFAVGDPGEGPANEQCGYMVFGWTPGLRNLREVMNKQHAQRFAEPRALLIIRRLLEILTAIHEQNVIHLDIKPENVLLHEKTDEVVLIDFDLAMKLSERVPVDDLNRVAGTIRFMSPEQVRGDVSYLDQRSDLNSVGAMLYEMVEGVPMFQGETFEDLYEQILELVPPSPSPACCSPDLARLIGKAVEKLPANRWQTADRFIGEVDLLETFPVGEDTDIVDAPPRETELSLEHSRRTDIGNFTQLSVLAKGQDKLSVEAFAKLLEEILGCLKGCVEPHKGMIWSGSSLPVQVVFGWQERGERAAESAEEAAREFLETVRVLRPGMEELISLQVALDVGRMQVVSTGGRIHSVVGSRHDVLFPEAPAWQLVFSPRFEKSRRIQAEYKLVGRDADLSILNDCWEDVLSGGYQVIGISGEGGLGKTRLLKEFVLGSASSEREHIAIRCSDRNSQYGFQAIRDCLYERWGLQDLLVEDARSNVHARLVELDLEASLPQFQSLLFPTVDGSTHIEAPRDLPIARKQPEVIVDWLHALAACGPLLLTVEDLHWCDSSTLGVLAEITRNPPLNLMLTVTTRPEGANLDALAVQSLLFLRPLTPKQVSLLIREMVPDHTPMESGQPEPGRLDTTGAGNPLFIITLVHSGWRPGDPVPPTLSHLLHERMQNARIHDLLLTYAALLDPFRKEVLFQLLDAKGINERSVQAQLQCLVRFRYLRPEARATGGTSATRLATSQRGRYQFAHALFPQAFLDRLTEQQYRERVEEILTIVDRQFPNLEREQPQRFAEFNALAGRHWKAIQLYQLVANRNLANGSYGEACHPLNCAIDLLSHLVEGPRRDDLEIDLQFLLARCLQEWKNLGVAFETSVNRAIELTRDRPERAIAFMTGSWFVGGYYIVRAELGKAFEVASEMKRMAGAHAPERLHFAYSMLSVIEFYRGHHASAEREAREAIRLLGEHENPIEPPLQNSNVITHSYLGRNLHFLDRDEEAIACFEKAIHIAEAKDAKWDMAFGLFFRSWHAAMLGDWEVALDHTRLLLELCERFSFESWKTAATLYQLAGRALGGQGAETEDLDAILARYQEVLAQERNRVSRHHYHYFFAKIQVQAGHHEEAFETLGQALESIQDREDKVGEEVLWILKGDITRDWGEPCQPDTARVFYENALRVSTERGSIRGARIAGERLNQLAGL